MYSSMALFFSVLAFLFSLFSFLNLKSYLKRRTSQEHYLSEVHEEANSIIKSIDEVTDRDISLILEREKNLRNLLKETEKRLSVYVKELDRTREADAVYAQVFTSQETSSAISYQEIGKNRHRIKAETTPVPVPASEPVPEQVSEPIPESAAQDKSPINEQIFSLVKAGFSSSIIASRLGISITEVELAAALFERREQFT